MSTKIDLERALLDPASVFAEPEAVRDHPDLSNDQKIEILRRWEYDESNIAVAEEEGMVDGTPPRLQRILIALEQLGADIDVDRSPPTKQEGV